MNVQEAMDGLDLQDGLLEAERIKNAEAAITDEQMRGLKILDDQICQDIDAVIERRQLATLGDVILDVLDAGDEGIPWGFYHGFEDVANEQRLRFRDAVIAKLRK